MECYVLLLGTFLKMPVGSNSVHTIWAIQRATHGAHQRGPLLYELYGIARQVEVAYVRLICTASRPRHNVRATGPFETANIGAGGGGSTRFLNMSLN